MNHKHRQDGKALVVVLLLLIAAAAALYYFYFYEQEEVPEQIAAPLIPERVIPVPSEPEPEPDSRTEIEEPAPPEPVIEEIAEETVTLPELAASDEEAVGVAAEMMGEDPARNLLVPEGLIPRLVATIDALTGDEVPGNIIPVRGPGGEMQATSDGVSDEVNPETGLPDPLYVLDPVNFQRYTPQVEVLEAVDTSELIENYKYYYPLLQQSYRELGYAEGEFDDRLAEVIDELLATPEPSYPVRLVKPEAFYEFIDPELEALPAGQKLLIRMGPSNAARVKAKLREIRAALQTQAE